VVGALSILQRLSVADLDVSMSRATLEIEAFAGSLM